MKLLATAFLMIFAFTVFAQTAATGSSTSQTITSNTNSKAEWVSETVDLGNITYMTPTVAEFTVKNTGTDPLLITYAKASCGCTNLKYSKEPIMPGKSSVISATYNGSGNGPFTKTITVQTSASSDKTVLKIKGNVVKE